MPEARRGQLDDVELFDRTPLMGLRNAMTDALTTARWQ
jgi:hypothetical protein